MTNTEQEELWVAGWNTLAERLLESGAKFIVDAAWIELTVDLAQGRIQDEAYQSNRVEIRDVWLKGQPTLQLLFNRV